MLACFKKANINPKITDIDTLEDSHKSDEYLAENPAGSLPMLENGYFKILGGSSLMYMYAMKQW